MPGVTSRHTPRVVDQPLEPAAATLARAMALAHLITHCAAADPQLLAIAADLLVTTRAFLELAAARGYRLG